MKPKTRKRKQPQQLKVEKRLTVEQISQWLGERIFEARKKPGGSDEGEVIGNLLLMAQNHANNLAVAEGLIREHLHDEKAS